MCIFRKKPNPSPYVRAYSTVESYFASEKTRHFFSARGYDYIALKGTGENLRLLRFPVACSHCEIIFSFAVAFLVFHCFCTPSLEQIKNVCPTTFIWIKCSPPSYIKKTTLFYCDFKNCSGIWVSFSSKEKKDLMPYAYYNISYKMKLFGFFDNPFFTTSEVILHSMNSIILFICLTEKNFSLHLNSIHYILSTEILLLES